MDEWQELLYNRCQALSDNYTLCFGGKEYTKEDVLKHINNKDEVYDILLEVEKAYFKTLRDGELAVLLADESNIL